jgi:hypothetical protein
MMMFQGLNVVHGKLSFILVLTIWCLVIWVLACLWSVICLSFQMSCTKTVALLNYSESEVSQTLMALNDGMNDAAGFTQESHNCNNNSDGSDNDDNPIAFSWGASETPECKASTSAYAEAAPLCKELLQELDEASPSTRNYGIGILKGSIIELKSRNAKRALSFCEGGVQGGIISSKVKSNTTKSKHRKQEYYPGMK